MALLIATLAASVAGLLALGPLTDGSAARRFDHAHALWGVANGWSLLLHLPLLAAACIGWITAGAKSMRPALRNGWGWFFALAIIATIGSMLDHLLPTAHGYLMARVPQASACAVLSALFLAERAGMAWVGRPALRLALTAGLVAGVLWLASMMIDGQGDDRALIWLTHLPILLVPLGAWSLPSRGLPSSAWIHALLWFALAELLERAGGAADIFGLHGHELHFLPLAACVASLAWSLQRQSMPAATANAGRSIQRATSLNTSA